MKKIFTNINKVIEYLIYIFVFLLAFQTRYIFRYLTLGANEFEYGKLSIYASDIIFALIVFLFLCFKIKQIKTIKLDKQFLICFLFLLICSINYFFASNLEMYFYYFLRIIECVAILFILQFVKIDFKKLFIFFITSIVFHGIIGIFQFINQNIEPNKYLGIAQHLSSAGGTSVLENCSGRFLRIYGGFTHPNVFGGFIVIAIIFLLILFFTDNNLNKKTRFSYFLISGFLLEVLFLTFSRSAFFALLICLFLLFIFQILKKSYKNLLVISLFIFIICFINIFIFKDLIYSRVLQEDRLELKSISERSILNNQAYKLLENNWVSGVGLGNYIPHIYENINSKLDVCDYQPVHNVYLLILSELGIWGLICYLLIFIYAIFNKIKQKNYLFILPILIILIINFFDHYFWTSHSGIALSFLTPYFNNNI